LIFNSLARFLIKGLKPTPWTIPPMVNLQYKS
jgi:hypothetical protein